MSTITKERLTELSRRENVGAILGEEIAELARIALASLEADPVCVIDQSNLDYLNSGSDADVWPASRKEIGDVLLYRTAPPAPVSVPDEATADDCPAFVKYDITDVDEAWARGFNACRSAMLQGADGKPELAVWYGAMPETNGKTNWTAILHRKGECLSTGITIDRSEYPDRVRYEADRLRYLIGESDKRPCIIDYDANAHSGYVEPVTTAYKLNSPVIPDGWVMVPVEPTAEMLQSGISAHYERSQIQIHDKPAPGPMEYAYVAMLSAAPQPEVK